MGRRKTGGWYLGKPDKRNGNYPVRFTHQGIERNLSTRKATRAEAQVEAARIYAEVVSGRQRVTARNFRPLAELMGEWLARIEDVVADDTFDSDVVRCQTHLLPYFKHVADITKLSIEDYTLARLKKVLRGTVRKERGTLLRFVKWAAGRGEMESVKFPQMPPKAPGKAAIDRPLIQVYDYQVEAIIAALPERTPRGHKPIKTKMRVHWESGIREVGMQRLRCPEHYYPGKPSKSLTVTKEIDKENVGRELRLTDETCVRLDARCAEIGEGLIFGKFDYLKPLRKAARKVADQVGLSERACKYIDARDFRHAAATDGADKSQQVSGITYMLGHKSAATTARYIDPGKRAADRLFEDRFPVTESVTEATGDQLQIISPKDLPADAKGFEPPTSASGGRPSSIEIAVFSDEFIETGWSKSVRFGATKPRFGAPCPKLASRPRT